MTQVHDPQTRMITLGDGTELQEWRVERLSDGSFEYHMYIGHNYSTQDFGIRSKGAIWMLFRIENAGEEDVTQETLYRMGRTKVPGSGEDTALTEWAGRAGATYYRFDEVLREFFS